MSMPITINLHQYTFILEPGTGNVLQITKKATIALTTTHPMVTKVYAAYARDVGIKSVEFNGSHYVKMYNRIINVNNGNEVTNNDIRRLFKE